MRKGFYGLLLFAFITACSHGGHSGLPPGASSAGFLTPQSVSPGLIKAAPMVRTAILPPSAMKSPVISNSPVSSLGWSQIPGSASVVVAAPDGTLWALSDQPAGANRSIWHYANGAWANIPGLASQIAVSQDGSLWAINLEGGIYHYVNGTWSTPGGGASNSIAADSSGGIFVLTNGASGGDKAIWNYSGTTWTQQIGSGIALAANWDTGTFPPGAGGSGTISPGGVYILNSLGQIYYENGTSLATIPGQGSAIAPTVNGGVFVLGYPYASAGNQIYYYDLKTPGWTTEPGSGVQSISANTNLFLTSSSGAIYTAALPVPAYCGAMNYSPASGGIRVDITDDSQIGAVLIVYIQNGTGWLTTNGTFTNASAAPNPLPAACFSTTKGSNGTVPLVIPTGVNGGRIYLALATPNPNGAIPNPFGDVNASTSGPPVGYQAAPFPWDKLEYGTILANTPTIDTTQVDALGLPIELSVPASATATPMPDDTLGPPGACAANPVTAGSAGPYGVTSCRFAQIFSTIGANTLYSPLVYTAFFNGRLLDMQVVSPSSAYQTSFDWTNLSGAVQAALKDYQITPRRFTNLVAGSQSPVPPAPTYYCASSDGSSNFLFTNNGAGMTCPTPPAPPPTFKLPAALLTYASVPQPANAGTVCMGNLVFSEPFGLAFVSPTLPYTDLFATNDAFAMWKALATDLNYGEALSTQTHPVGQVSPPPITVNGLFHDSRYNTYDKVLHDNFNGGLAYGIAYDDVYTLESGVPMSASGGSIVLRINPIPSASSVTPGAKPSQMAIPSPCPTISPGVGSY